MGEGEFRQLECYLMRPYSYDPGCPSVLLVARRSLSSPSLRPRCLSLEAEERGIGSGGVDEGFVCSRLGFAH